MGVRCPILVLRADESPSQCQEERKFTRTSGMLAYSNTVFGYALYIYIYICRGSTYVKKSICISSFGRSPAWKDPCDRHGMTRLAAHQLQ